MKFGVREICDVVFKAKSDVQIGSARFQKGQPVLYIDTAKTSTIEGAATTVYAQGGKGNTRLIAWEGEKTLTFTVEDALLSPIGFAVLSGAGLFKGKTNTEKVHVHMTTTQLVATDGTINLADAIGTRTICEDAPIFIVALEKDGSIAPSEAIKATKVLGSTITVDPTNRGKMVLVDYYVVTDGNTVSELQIDAGNFGGYYYVEASTLFRRQEDGVDMPAEITFPNVKIQSNFTFSMSSSGDPSTFTFTMDAFPGYTYFNPEKKVLCVIQTIEDTTAVETTIGSVMSHKDGGEVFDAYNEPEQDGTDGEISTDKGFDDSWKKTV